MTLACVVLHNLCIERGDVTLRHWDMSLDPIQNERQPSEIVRETLHMANSPQIPSTSKQAAKIRDILKMKFHKEKENNY